MNVLVIGAAGKTGEQVVRRALAEGHRVTALVRDAGTYAPPSPDVRVVGGDATDPSTVAGAVEGQQGVIDTVGGKTPYLNTELERNIAAAAVAAMKQHGVRRLVVVSVLGAGDSRQKVGFLYRNLLLRTFLRGAIKDKNAMEDRVRRSGLDFVLVRPPVLKVGPATGNVKVSTGGGAAGSITRADLAAFLVDQLTDDAHLGRAVVVANG